MTDNGNKPAHGYGYTTADGQSHVEETGLTKREYFAAMAMQGLMASGYNPSTVRQIDERNIAHKAVLIADALLEELEPTPESEVKHTSEDL